MKNIIFKVMMLNIEINGIPDIFVIIGLSFLVMYLGQKYESKEKFDNRNKNNKENA